MNGMPKISECYIVGYDCSKEEDFVCLVVSKIVGTQLQVINMLFNEEATSLYEKLKSDSIGLVDQNGCVLTDNETYSKHMESLGYINAWKEHKFEL